MILSMVILAANQGTYIGTAASGSEILHASLTGKES
jgi:hypothetical protein